MSDAAAIVPKLALSIEEACQALTISRPTLYELIAKGRIRTVMVGRRRLVPLTELERLMAGDDVVTRRDRPRKAGPTDAARRADFAELAMRSAKSRSSRAKTVG